MNMLTIQIPNKYSKEKKMSAIEEAVKKLIQLDKEITILELEKHKYRSQLLADMDAKGANKYPDSFNVEGKTYTVERRTIRHPQGTFDQSLLTGLRELLSPENFRKAWSPGYEKITNIEAKYDGKVLAQFARQYGGEIAEIIEEARLPVGHDINVKEVI